MTPKSPELGRISGNISGGTANALQRDWANCADLKVHQEGSRGIGDVREVLPAAGQMPDQERIDGSRGELASGRSGTSAGDMIKNPRNLGGRKVGIDDQTGTRSDPVSLALQSLTDGGGAAILPHQGWGDRPACGTLPDDRGFPLVGESDGRDSIGLHPRVKEGHRHLRLDRGDQRVGIVFDPSGPRVNGRDLDLPLSHHFQAGIVNDRPRA